MSLRVRSAVHLHEAGAGTGSLGLEVLTFCGRLSTFRWLPRVFKNLGRGVF